MLEIDEAAVEPLVEMGPIRITAAESDGEVELSIDHAESVVEGDQVVERGGARVYLDAAAADVLADQVLGVHTHGDHFHFTFDEQPG